jgi:predicted type IV restriction endonuclease
MKPKITAFIDELKSNKQISSFDKASTKQAVVLRLLSLLGWDIFNVDEVKPIDNVKPKNVDYSLRSKNIDRVFIKVLKINEELNGFQEGLVASAAKEKVDISVLTNGLIWRFYLSLMAGNLEQKTFYTLDLLKQKPGDVATQFLNFLEKENISSGKSLETANARQNEKQQNAVEDAIPSAWSKIISEPDAVLVNLLSETTEKLCGFKPEKKRLVKFLTERSKIPQTPAVDNVAHTSRPVSPVVEKQSKNTSRPVPPVVEKQPENNSKPVPKGFEGQVLSSFTFKEMTCDVKSWDDLVVKLCEILKSKYNHDTESLLWHSVGKKFYFSKNQGDFRFPSPIRDTDIFVETHLSPNETVKTARSVLTALGYPESDLIIDLKKK